MQRKMNLFIGFLILVLFGLVLGGSAQTSLNADLLLNQTETNVLELVKQVQANALNSCDLLSTCNAESTCSRLSCPLTSANTAGYECQEVLQNTNCNGNCPWRNFDFSRSFLRSDRKDIIWPTSTLLASENYFVLLVDVRVPGVKAVTKDYITQRQLQGICAQRKLDSFFQKHSNNSNFFRLYFGSVDGTFRIFPGMDESIANCSNYDPRTRLWYLTSTSNVKKAVMVLIDSGSSMTETIPSTRNDSNLVTAFGMTTSFLNTTTQADYVNIFTFDKNNVNFSSPQPVSVTDTSDFGVFTATLSAPNQSSVPSGNITEAISNVITSSAGFGYTEIPIEYLKVIILITDSNAVGAISNATLLKDLIKNNNIKVFLYMFSPSTPAIDASQLCTARGYWTILDDPTVHDPLLALEAYYSFLANVHATYVNTGIDYSIEYQDYSEVDNKTFTLSKAVFSNNGELLGVVAINLFKTKLLEVYGINGAAIEEAVRSRTNFTSNFNASTGINTTNCFNQASNQTCNPTANISNIVCSSNFDSDITTLRNLSCCNCTGVTMPPVSPPATAAGAANKPRDLRLALGFGLGVGIPALILVVALIAWPFRRKRHRLDEFSGPSGEDEDLR